MRRWFAQAVVLAFMLPALIGLLPQLALSASSALERDVLTSVCGQNGSGQQDRDRHSASHEHCVLCGNPCPNCSPSLADATPAFGARPALAGVPRAATADIMPAPLQALLDASPPRGPPAIS